MLSAEQGAQQGGGGCWGWGLQKAQPVPCLAALPLPCSCCIHRLALLIQHTCFGMLCLQTVLTSKQIAMTVSLLQTSGSTHILPGHFLKAESVDIVCMSRQLNADSIALTPSLHHHAWQIHCTESGQSLWISWLLELTKCAGKAQAWPNQNCYKSCTDDM